MFDGVCNLCNTAVKTIIRSDRNKKFKYGSLQGDAGKHMISEYDLSHPELSTFILIEKGKAYTKSTAALRVARKMDGLWPLLYIFILVPVPIRNWVYDYIAKKRYAWFGRKKECWIPEEPIKDRFID